MASSRPKLLPSHAFSRIFWTLAFWVGLDHCYPRLFPWHLGGALYGREWLVQGADLFGASGLTVLVFLANAVIVLVVGFVRGRNRFPAGSGSPPRARAAGAAVPPRWPATEPVGGSRAAAGVADR